MNILILSLTILSSYNNTIKLPNNLLENNTKTSICTYTTKDRSKCIIDSYGENTSLITISDSEIVNILTHTSVNIIVNYDCPENTLNILTPESHEEAIVADTLKNDNLFKILLKKHCKDQRNKK